MNFHPGSKDVPEEDFQIQRQIDFLLFFVFRRISNTKVNFLGTQGSNFHEIRTSTVSENMFLFFALFINQQERFLRILFAAELKNYVSDTLLMMTHKTITY